jgi:hypothetical protein
VGAVVDDGCSGATAAEGRLGADDLGCWANKAAGSENSLAFKLARPRKNGARGPVDGQSPSEDSSSESSI